MKQIAENYSRQLLTQGVSKRGKKWQAYAYIQTNEKKWKQQNLGTFSSKEEALSARQKFQLSKIN